MCNLCPGETVIKCFHSNENSNESHEYCSNCLTSYMKVLTNQNLEEIKKREGKIKCYDENCSNYLLESEVAKNVSNDIFLSYISSLKSYLINEELNKKVSENEIDKANKTIQEIMNSKCPNCSQVWYNSDACMAVECSKCGIRFCGFCCEKSFQDKHTHHNHVSNCTYNPRKGDYFCSQKSLEEIVIKRNYKTIENYLSFLKNYIKPDIYEKITNLDILKKFMYEKDLLDINQTIMINEIYDKALIFFVKYNVNINDKIFNYYNVNKRLYYTKSLPELMLINKNYDLFYECLEQGADINLIPNFFSRFISEDERQINNLFDNEFVIEKLIKIYNYIDINTIPYNYLKILNFERSLDNYFISFLVYNLKNNIPIKIYIHNKLNEIFLFNKKIIFRNKAIEDFNFPDFLSTNTLLLLSQIKQNYFSINLFKIYFEDKILYDEDIILGLYEHENKDSTKKYSNSNFMIEYYLNQNNDSIIYELINNIQILNIINYNNKLILFDKIKEYQIDDFSIKILIKHYYHDSDIIKIIDKTNVDILKNNLNELLMIKDVPPHNYYEYTVKYYELVLTYLLKKGITKEKILSLIKKINSINLIKAIYNIIGEEVFSCEINNILLLCIINLNISGSNISMIENDDDEETQLNENFNKILVSFKKEILYDFLVNFKETENTKKRKFEVINDSLDSTVIDEILEINDEDLEDIE